MPTQGPHPDPTRLIAASGAEGAVPYPTLEKISGSTRSPFWQREDPYFDAWLEASRAATTEKSVVRLEEVDGEWRLVMRDQFISHRSAAGARSWAKLMNSSHLPMIVALLNAFHHATARQLHACCGYDWYNSSRHLKRPYDHGVLQRGKFPKSPLIPGKLPYLYALHDGRPLRRVLKSLDDSACRRILGNASRQTSTAAGRHVRHDLLAFEVALRILETQDHIVAVTGEHLSSPAALLPNLRPARSFRADLTLHRYDGLRVAIELAASRHPDHLRHTIEKWALLLVNLPPQDSGLVVVILNADDTRHTTTAANLRTMLTEATSREHLRCADGMMPAPHEIQRARSQIHLASWVDWFPEARSVSEAGRGLYTAMLDDGGRWTARALAYPSSYACTPRPGRRWPIPDSDNSLVVPPWAGTPRLYGVDDVASPR